MTIDNSKDRVIETDILVIGGGIGGCFAALYAIEGGAQVVLLDKAAVRRSGAAGMGIAMWHQLLPPGFTLNDIAKDLITSGRKFLGTASYMSIMKGLIDENLIYIGYRDSWEVVNALEKWGINMKWDDGQYFFSPDPSMPDNIFFHGRNIKRGLADQLKSSSVTVLERTMGVDLLTKNGEIAGATALNVRSGEFIIIKAKAIVLATGTISRIFNPFLQTAPGRFRMLYNYYAGSGDGIAMAFRAGADLVNIEVSGVGAFLAGTRTEKIPTYFVPSGARIYDAKGEQLERENCPGGLSIRTQYKLEREGRAPCLYDAIHLPDKWHEAMLAEDWNEGVSADEWRELIKIHPLLKPECQPINVKFLKDRGLNTRKERYEILHYRPEHNSIIGGLRYDENGQTTVKSLFAVGDMTGGSTLMGAAQAAVFGMRAAKHATTNLVKMHQLAIDKSQVVDQKEMVLAPQKVKRGVEPLEVEIKIRDIVERYCGPERSEGGIIQGLSRLRQIRNKFLPELTARDYHELMTAQEVRNLFLMAEVYMVCAREREEGGMNNYRLDRPEKADVPWEKAIVARLEKGEIKISRKKMPELKQEYRSK